MRYTYGIIGCQHGHIATFIREMEALGARCAGIYEPDEPALAERLSRQHSIPLVQSAEELLRPEVGVIGSSAVNNRKLDVIELCEAHGKSVMLDKPIVTNRDQLNRLADVMARGRIQVGMLLTERFRPAAISLKRMIEEGELGRIVSVTMRKPHRLSPAQRHRWHFSKEQNGGLIQDLFIHDFDLLRWWTGQEFVRVDSLMTKTILPEHPDFYDTACAQVLLTGGTLAQLYADWHTPDKSWTWGDCRIFVSGTAGCAELRLCGDPSVASAANEELLLRVTNASAFERIDLPTPATTITEDFLNRLEGRDSIIGHRDILEACRAAVSADERAVVVNAFQPNRNEVTT
ncbi:Gfo/Idh/MocA family protein [Paenibacillus sp. HJGM_3]|uniref:Gfo/Idh/MocA family protein n=1 Tax=Paenibacillus sp. HJGM_3 TaxID=3379816 RepID=UPI0038595E42